jgi:ketosteroid isomerase-like protein
MTDLDIRRLITHYLDAYNAFDIDGMMATIHPDVLFENVSGGEMNASAAGAADFRSLAEYAAGVFETRRQTATAFAIEDDRATVEVMYEGVPSADLPNGMKAGEVVRLQGRTHFEFRDGKISRIVDHS